MNLDSKILRFGATCALKTFHSYVCDSHSYVCDSLEEFTEVESTVNDDILFFQRHPALRAFSADSLRLCSISISAVRSWQVIFATQQIAGLKHRNVG